MKHKRTCVGGRVADPAVAAKRRRIGGVVPGRKDSKIAWRCCREVHYRYERSKALVSNEESCGCFQACNGKDHQAYKFQIAVDVIFHKAVDPAVITQPPVI